MCDTNIAAGAAGKTRVFEFTERGEYVPVTVGDIRMILNAYPFKPSVQLYIPEGSMYLPRNAKLTADLALEIQTNGEFSIF